MKKRMALSGQSGAWSAQCGDEGPRQARSMVTVRSELCDRLHLGFEIRMQIAHGYQDGGMERNAALRCVRSGARRAHQPASPRQTDSFSLTDTNLQILEFHIARYSQYL